VSVAVARNLDEVLDHISSATDVTLLAGGTDLMVDLNFGRKRPGRVLAIDRVPELADLERDDRVRIGAGVTYTRMLAEDVGSAALREAARTVGSPQIRNAGTLGGNIATSSPAGDTLPVLAALDEYVGVSNTNVHLLAGIAKTARVLVPYPGEWRWMRRPGSSPWFPGFELYRQPQSRDWTGALEKLRADLFKGRNAT